MHAHRQIRKERSNNKPNWRTTLSIIIVRNFFNTTLHVAVRLVRKKSIPDDRTTLIFMTILQCERNDSQMMMMMRLHGLA